MPGNLPAKDPRYIGKVYSCSKTMVIAAQQGCIVVSHATIYKSSGLWLSRNMQDPSLIPNKKKPYVLDSQATSQSRGDVVADESRSSSSLVGQTT